VIQEAIEMWSLLSFLTLHYAAGALAMVKNGDS